MGFVEKIWTVGLTKDRTWMDEQIVCYSWPCVCELRGEHISTATRTDERKVRVCCWVRCLTRTGTLKFSLRFRELATSVPIRFGPKVWQSQCQKKPASIDSALRQQPSARDSVGASPVSFENLLFCSSPAKYRSNSKEMVVIWKKQEKINLWVRIV